MAEYIERESAVSALEKALYSYEDETEAKFKDDPELDLAEWFFHRIFVQVMNGHDRQAILDLPAADVRPVVHGHWVYEEPNGANSFKSAYWCDQCHQPEPYRKNFCPSCGADMREKS